MKTSIPRLCAVLSLGFISLATAQEGGGPRPQGGGQGGMGQGGPGGFLARMPITKALDKDANGELSAEEIAGATAALLTLDKNGDGKLSEDEIRPVRQPRGETPQQTAHQTLENFDKNKDGKITADELPERMKAMIDRFDENKDGAVTEEELVKGQEKEKPAEPAPAPRPEGDAGNKPGV